MHVIPAFAILATLLLGISAAVSWRGMIVQQVERRHMEPWSGARHAILARESVTRSLFLLLTPLRSVELIPPVCQGQVPAVLVPDPVVGRAALWFLQTFLRHRGVCAWRAHLPMYDQTLHERAETLAAEVARVREVTGADQVDLIGFGTGGLIAAWFVAHRRSEDDVRRLITLGTPWRGTQMAVFYDGAIAIEALPNSQDLDGLLPPAVPTLSVWCPDDPEVVPARSACADVDHSVAIEGAGHLGMLLSARTFRAVLTGLSEPLGMAD